MKLNIVIKYLIFYYNKTWNTYITYYLKNVCQFCPKTKRFQNLLYIYENFITVKFKFLLYIRELYMKQI